MTSTPSYRIVVPSRKRPQNMAKLLGLLPGATICVDEREADDYADAVPRGSLLLHPPITGGPAVRNWIIEHTEEPVLVQCDDDLVGVKVLTGSGRTLTNPEDIRDVIENSMVACADLGLTTFCFSRVANPIVLDPDLIPVRPIQPVFGLWGVMGAARRRRYDESLRSRADLDWTLRTLLEDRIVYADMRFYFDFGSSFTNPGGNSGLVTAEDFEAAALALKQRWGKHVTFESPNYDEKRSKTAVGSIRVRRRADRAGGGG